MALPRKTIRPLSFLLKPTTPLPIPLTRHIHTSTNRPISLSSTTTPDAASSSSSSSSPLASGNPPLSLLPTPLLLRSFLVTSISSTPWLLGPSMSILSFLGRRKRGFVLNPDRNPLIHWALKKTFYEHFCAGETPDEVRRTVGNVKAMGCAGVILTYARETVVQGRLKEVDARDVKGAMEVAESPELEAWRDGNLRTVELVGSGDFLALKFSGAGPSVLDALANRSPIPAQMVSALTAICQRARERGVRMLVDAEQSTIQAGIDEWGLELMSRFNRDGKATVFGTYQAYLKSTGQKIQEHLQRAKKEGFALGVKLVRGAYISSEPRGLINDTKADTDEMFDLISTGLLRGAYGDLKGPDMPAVNLFLATHNLQSTRNAYRIRKALLQEGQKTIPVEYGQLLGMADEVSCELLQAGGQRDSPDAPKVYKCLSWGTLGECVAYLLRRAVENRDAVGRTKESRSDLWKEVRRRFWW